MNIENKLSFKVENANYKFFEVEYSVLSTTIERLLFYCLMYNDPPASFASNQKLRLSCETVTKAGVELFSSS
jgi:hypothetical protein